jgi:hypothetical protein
MKRLILTATLIAAGLATSACVTIIDAGHDHDDGWRGKNAAPFDGARADCLERTGDVHSAAFTDCMAEKGWTRD